MKFITTLVLGLLATPTLATAAECGEAQRPFSVTVARVEEQPEQVRLDYRTLQTFSSMCPLIERSREIGQGAIELEVGAEAGGFCLPAFGPRQGSSTFAVGEEALQPGSYELRINGVNYGTVEITEDSATLVAPVDACE
jgi:hypothetical protein